MRKTIRCCAHNMHNMKQAKAANEARSLKKVDDKENTRYNSTGVAQHIHFNNCGISLILDNLYN